MGAGKGSELRSQGHVARGLAPIRRLRSVRPPQPLVRVRGGPARSAARSAVETAGAERGWRMALRGPEVFGPGSRGSLDEAGAEGREAAALAAAAGVALEDDEEDDGRRGLLRWDGFSAWLHCVCVVGFDLELGQAVEVRPGRILSPPFAREPGGRVLAAAHPGVARSPCTAQLGGARPALPWEDRGLRLGVKSSL